MVERFSECANAIRMATLVGMDRDGHIDEALTFLDTLPRGMFDLPRGNPRTTG